MGAVGQRTARAVDSSGNSSARRFENCSSRHRKNQRGRWCHARDGSIRNHADSSHLMERLSMVADRPSHARVQKSRTESRFRRGRKNLAFGQNKNICESAAPEGSKRGGKGNRDRRVSDAARKIARRRELHSRRQSWSKRRRVRVAAPWRFKRREHGSRGNGEQERRFRRKDAACFNFAAA